VSDIKFDDVCLLFALRREARPFYRGFPPQQTFPGAPCVARFCGPAWLTVLVLETGMGASRVEAALGWALTGPVLENVPYRPKLVVSAGFCGALQDQLQVGDVVLATDVVEPDGTVRSTTWPGELPPGEWRPPLHRGRLLGTDGPIVDPAAKRRLGERHTALAVDMEATAVARMCAKHGVPFGCVRAVSDAAATGLSPKLGALVAGGRVSPWKALTAAATSPGLAKEMWGLAKHTARAADQLAAALGELLTLTLPWSAE
jgi:adenosylhomocysteine nucleosidase